MDKYRHAKFGLLSSLKDIRLKIHKAVASGFGSILKYFFE